MNNRLCLLVCNNHEPDVRAVVQADGLEDVDVHTFPFRCELMRKENNFPGPMLERLKKDYDRVYPLGGPCVQIAENLSAGHKASGMGLCFYLFLNKEIVDALLKDGAYLLTPGWLKSWQRQIEEWGFEQAKARIFFKEFATKLILLDTGTDQDSRKHLEEFAAYLSLPFEIIPVGLDFLRMLILKIVDEWRIEKLKSSSHSIQSRLNQQLADYAMTVDLLDRLTGLNSEEKVIENIFELFSMLCAPERIVYLSFIDNSPHNIYTRPADIKDKEAIRGRLTVPDDGDYSFTESGKGFKLKIEKKGNTLGIIEIDEIAFPEHREYYLNLSTVIVKICSLAIENARTYQKLGNTLVELEKTISEQHKTEEMLRYSGTHDALTGLYNRGYFEEETARLKRGRQFPVSIVMIDVDDLKAVNDNQGHAAGDKLLKRTTEVLQASFRAEDIIARIGGDEFAVLLRGNDLNAGLLALERVRSTLAAYNAKHRSSPLSLSLGVATAQNGALLDETLKEADEQMYQEKRVRKERKT